MFKHQDLQMFGLNLTNMNKLHSLEVVGRGNETQLQVTIVTIATSDYSHKMFAPFYPPRHEFCRKMVVSADEKLAETLLAYTWLAKTTLRNGLRVIS